jgi:hypothetical protein
VRKIKGFWAPPAGSCKNWGCPRCQIWSRNKVRKNWGRFASKFTLNRETKTMTQSRFAPHQKGILKWCGRHADWFWQNSHREYRLTTNSIRQMENLAGSHGIFTGCATACGGGAKPNTSGRGLHVEPDFPHTSMRGPRSIPCIVRRPDSAQARPLPGVFLLDGMTAPSAPPNGAPAPDVNEEAFCAAWWGRADALRAMWGWCCAGSPRKSTGRPTMAAWSTRSRGTVKFRSVPAGRKLWQPKCV